MTIRASSTDHPYHTHMLSLTDGTNTIGLNAVDSKGRPEIRNLRRVPYPRSTIAVGSASGQLSERRAPFGEFSKTDWSGGLAMDDAEADSTRYWFGERIWSQVGDKILLAPRIFYGDYYGFGAVEHPGQTQNEPRPSDVNLSVTAGWHQLTGSQLYMASKWTNAQAQTVSSIILFLHVVGVPTVTVTIRADNAGAPGTVLATATRAAYWVVGRLRYRFEFDAAEALSAATDYWLVITASGVDDNTWVKVGSRTNAAYTLVWSAAGSSWAAVASTYPPIFRMINAAQWQWGQMFEYKGGVYAVVRTGAGVLLLRNGTRGVAASNAADKTKLNHNGTSPAWVTNQWAGCVAVITGGTGYQEWQYIASNDANTLTTSAGNSWSTTHDTTTEYAIIGAIDWTLVTGHGMTNAEAVAVSDLGVIYVAQGEGTAMRRIREYNNSGVWTMEAAADSTNKASYLVEGFDQTLGNVIWRGQNPSSGTSPNSVSSAPAVAWGTDLTFGTEVKLGGGMSTGEQITGLSVYDGKLAVLTNASVWMVLNGVPDKLSIELHNRMLTNGQRPLVMSPYLVFPYGNGLERLYNNLVEDFGPERDDGLPGVYAGVYRDTTMMPGALLATVDGAYNGVYGGGTEGRGGVYCYKNSGWHPIASMPYGCHPLALHAQAVQSRLDSLHILTVDGMAMMYWPRESDYRRDVNYEADGNLHSDGCLLSGWHQAGNLMVEKYWKDITLHAQIPTGCSVEVWYQTEDDAIGIVGTLESPMRQVRWHLAGEATTTTEFTHTVALAVTSRRLRLLLRLTGTGNVTPELDGYNIEYMARVEAGRAYPLISRVNDLGYERHPGGTESGQGVTAAMAVLDAWADRATPLTMRCIIEAYDDKLVLLDGPGLQTLWAEAPESVSNQLISMTLIEAE